MGANTQDRPGKITTCQIGVFAAYVSRHGHAFIDRALYLSKAWTDDPARMAAAHVQARTAFATKPRLALAMSARAIAANAPFAWVAADRSATIWMGRRRQSGWPFWRSRRCDDCRRATITQALFGER